ncbi:c-type cytochrome [Bordetella sp. BOR01]|uniref:c-type cytochrome n=1 Tax=Bordetella sp. BOR01 TaxID=2854779 RepID=UPI001C43ED32|nr:cytochrome c [Bordetella sp. BOR01]MBV7486099.1 cytochrome c [Bordetella sp. BOR01]
MLLPFALAAASMAQQAPAAGRYGIGTPLSETRLEPWNIDVAPGGRNLPAGQGTVAAGRALYAAQCAACHGAQGEGGQGDRLAGGAGTLASPKPIRTVGSYWPYATTLYDYIRRAMPLQAPQSLSSDEVYAATAYILHLNGLLPDNATLDAQSLRQVRMPNRDGFVDDPRPDVGPTAAR